MTQLPISPGEDHDGMAYYIRQGTEPAPTLPVKSVCLTPAPLTVDATLSYCTESDDDETVGTIPN